LAFALVGSLLLLACSGDDGDSNAADTTSAVVTTSSVVTFTPPHDPVEADVPAEYLDAILADVAARSGLAAADLTVLDSTAVEWLDQRLGCVHLPAPEQPAPVDGYRVVVDTGNAQFDYRLDGAGTPYLCGDPITTSNGEDDGDHHEDEDPPEESSS
jgi:hypothetical protein